MNLQTRLPWTHTRSLSMYDLNKFYELDELTNEAIEIPIHRKQSLTLEFEHLCWISFLKTFKSVVQVVIGE